MRKGLVLAALVWSAPALAQTVQPPIIPPQTAPPFVYNGLGVGIGPGTLVFGTGGSNYAVGDRITMTCSAVQWSTKPIITVNTISGGVIVGGTVTNPGVGNSATGVTCNLTQFSTSGSGTGATFTATIAPIAASLSLAGLNTGGGAANGNTFIGASTPLSTFGGSESTFIGAYAGLSLTGSNFGNTAVGEDACGGDQGVFSNTGPGGNDCYGNDAGRNLSGSGGQNFFAGQNAGRGSDVSGNTGNQNTYIGNGSGKGNTTGGTNVGVGVSTLNTITTGTNNLMAGAYAGAIITTATGNTGLGRFSLTSLISGTNDTAVGLNSMANATGSSNTGVGAGTLTFATGNLNTALGLNSGSTVTSGANNVLIGPGVASTTLTTGSNNIYLGNASNCDGASSSESATFRLCELSGSTSAITASLTAGQVVITTDGPVQLKAYLVGGLPTCNGGAAGELAYVTDANAPTYNSILTGSSTTKALALCNGTNWVAH